MSENAVKVAQPGNILDEPLKLNLGAGRVRKPGFLSVDSIPFDGLDVVCDLRERWPWDDNTVDEIEMSHVMEHFTGDERVHIVNEMYRVMMPDAKALIITPHWNSQRAYGDFTHKWPPVSEFWYYYLSKEWRMQNAPHNDIEFNPNGYNCDFGFAGGYGLHADINLWNDERKRYAQQWFKEVCTDIFMTINCKKPKLEKKE